jgi:hypothetical protein
MKIGIGRKLAPLPSFFFFSFFCLFWEPSSVSPTEVGLSAS